MQNSFFFPSREDFLIDSSNEITFDKEQFLKKTVPLSRDFVPLIDFPREPFALLKDQYFSWLRLLDKLSSHPDYSRMVSSHKTVMRKTGSNYR